MFDVRRAFFQLELDPECRKYTAFSIDGKLYNFKRIAMGLSIGTQALVRALDDVFSDMKGNGLWYFCDDLVVYSKNMEEHALMLRKVFDRLKERGLTVAPSKIQLFRKRIPFLGFLVGGGDV